MNFPPLATSIAAVSREFEFTSYSRYQHECLHIFAPKREQCQYFQIYIFTARVLLWKRLRGMLASTLYLYLYLYTYLYLCLYLYSKSLTVEKVEGNAGMYP